MATSSLRSGYLLLILVSSGPMVPGRSPPLIAWQVRQLPLPRSNASFCPSATADCAAAGPAHAAAPSANARITTHFLEKVSVKGISRLVYFGCMVSSGPVVRGVRFLPSAVDTILMSAGSAHALMQALAMVSGLGSVQTKLSRLGILTFGKLSRSATNALGTRSFRCRI